MKSHRLELLLTLILGAFLTAPAFAISVASLSDFQATTEGWLNGALASNGGHDGFLIGPTTAAGLPGSRLITANFEAEWLGDYIAAGVSGLLLDLRNVNGASPTFPIPQVLEIRIAVAGPGGAFVTEPSFMMDPAGLWMDGIFFDLNTLVPIEDGPTGSGVLAGFNLGATLNR